MIEWEFEDNPKPTNSIYTITIPDTDGKQYDADWIYKKFDVLLRIVCSDGTFLVVIRKEF